MISTSFGSHAQIIDTIGIANLRDALEIPDTHVRTMKVRDSIPVEYWDAVVAAAKKAGISGLTVDRIRQIRIEKRAEERGVKAAETDAAAARNKRKRGAK